MKAFIVFFSLRINEFIERILKYWGKIFNIKKETSFHWQVHLNGSKLSTVKENDHALLIQKKHAN